MGSQTTIKERTLLCGRGREREKEKKSVRVIERVRRRERKRGEWVGSLLAS
jgi:hypothetical protein